MFVSSGALLFGCAVVLHPSFFVIIVASFLTLGFVLKAVAHLTFGAPLIEPVGEFSGSATQWDMALKFATAGQLGGVASFILASFIPSYGRILPSDDAGQRNLGNVLFAALAILIVVATCVYALNHQHSILRIGYPLGMDIHPRVYAVLAFILTWGALLGGLALTQWLIELGRLRYASLIIVASFLGFLSSLTIGSRIQFLLYILASLCILLSRRRDIQRWTEIALALCSAGVLFVLSIAIVSIERNFAFQNSDLIAVQNPTSSTAAPRVVVGGKDVSERSARLPPSFPKSLSAPPDKPESSLTQGPVPDPKRQQYLYAAPETAAFATKLDVVTSNSRLSGVLQELRSLVLMRWVGLEGVLTAQGAESELGRNLFMQGLTEDPATGKAGIYQTMAGNPYGRVEVFTFLTLPGLIGFASYSGSIPLIFGFAFGTTLIGHLVEWFACRITGNVAVGAVSGVSLAYLAVQMCFPWTLFIYAMELCLACAALGGFWFSSRWLVRSRI
ncbi:hypothetical protein CV770_40520 [Bradyrhizobium sp. AC87j1]|nr:hypothetical protein CV770_40520 [Bradyrhizobium sp. AC87j1]